VELERCKRILLFGGTFDPPHVAHVALPLAAMEAVEAEALAYIPAAQSPHKAGAPPTPPRHRLAMLRLALASVPQAVVLTDELDRFAADPRRPSFTVDTLEALRERLPRSVEMRLLLGADQLLAFHHWWRPERIIELAEPVVMLRPPHTREALLAALDKSLIKADWARRCVEVPQMDVSATEIRRRVAAGRPVSGLVAPAVADYIARQGLYR
jgi:nicotinate-nucleotide adenylyltransferase